MDLTDTKGLQKVKALKIDGCSAWFGTSSNIAAIDLTATNVLTCSFTNYSAHGATVVFNSANSTAATNSAMITRIFDILEAHGMVATKHDGTAP